MSQSGSWALRTGYQGPGNLVAVLDSEIPPRWPKDFDVSKQEQLGTRIPSNIRSSGVCPPCIHLHVVDLTQVELPRPAFASRFLIIRFRPSPLRGCRRARPSATDHQPSSTSDLNSHQRRSQDLRSLSVSTPARTHKAARSDVFCPIHFGRLLPLGRSSMFSLTFVEFSGFLHSSRCRPCGG
ncbi:hypothetical protein DPEC_G00364630 [Dallia pectoralis]|nr:hypothetical protein DPEC_G00364630 [Dallia pectoralis]